MPDNKTAFLLRLAKMCELKGPQPRLPKDTGRKQTGLAEIMRDAYPHIDNLKSEGYTWNEIIIMLQGVFLPIEHPERLTKFIISPCLSG